MKEANQKACLKLQKLSKQLMKYVRHAAIYDGPNTTAGVHGVQQRSPPPTAQTQHSAEGRSQSKLTAGERSRKLHLHMVARQQRSGGMGCTHTSPRTQPSALAELVFWEQELGRW